MQILTLLKANNRSREQEISMHYLDMVEVASSNLAGPTKYDRPGLVPGFSYLAWR